MDRSLLHSHGPNLFDLYIEYIKVFYLWLDTKDLDPSNYRQMCSAMEMYNEADPMTLLDAANAMTTIAGKEDEYGKVTEDQLMKAMETSCPDGHKKFLSLAEGA